MHLCQRWENGLQLRLVTAKYQHIPDAAHLQTYEDDESWPGIGLFYNQETTDHEGIHT